MRAEKSENRLLFLLLDRGRGLRCLSLDHPLLELVHSTGGIDELLRTSVEGMARIADTDNNHGLGGAGLDHVSAGATDFRVHIFGMYGFFHTKAGKHSINPSGDKRQIWQISANYPFRIKT